MGDWELQENSCRGELLPQPAAEATADCGPPATEGAEDRRAVATFELWLMEMQRLLPKSCDSNFGPYVSAKSFSGLGGF